MYLWGGSWLHNVKLNKTRFRQQLKSCQLQPCRHTLTICAALTQEEFRLHTLDERLPFQLLLRGVLLIKLNNSYIRSRPCSPRFVSSVWFSCQNITCRSFVLSKQPSGFARIREIICNFSAHKLRRSFLDFLWGFQEYLEKICMFGNWMYPTGSTLIPDTLGFKSHRYERQGSKSPTLGEGWSRSLCSVNHRNDIRLKPNSYKCFLFPLPVINKNEKGQSFCAFQVLLLFQKQRWR